MDGVSAEDIRVYSSNDTKCPSCGGRLVFEPVEQMLKCGFCGNTYTPEKIELLQQLPEIDTGAADENEDDKCEIVCDSCGAVLITDKNTVDVLLVLLVIAIFGAFLAGLFFAGMHFIMSGAGFVFLLALVALASPIGLMVFMGYRFKLQAAEKAEPFFEFLTRPVRKLSARRHDSYIDLLNETNMVVGPRPSADTYYDSKARIKFENAEVFSNSEM